MRRQRPAIFYLHIIMLLLPVILAAILSGCVNEQSESFPSIRPSQTATEPAEEGNLPDQPIPLPDLNHTAITLSIAAPLSEENLNRIRLLYLYSLQNTRTDSKGSALAETAALNNADLEDQVPLLHQFNYDLAQLDSFLADFEKDNLTLELLPVSLAEGASGQQQAIWLDNNEGPQIFYAVEAYSYYKQNRLMSLNAAAAQEHQLQSRMFQASLLKPYYGLDGLLGLPALLTYPIIIGSRQALSDYAIDKSFSWQTFLTAAASNSVPDDQSEQPPAQENPTDVPDMDDNWMPFTLKQPWLTYFQLSAWTPEQTRARLYEGTDVPADLPPEELIMAWQKLLKASPRIAEGGIETDLEDGLEASYLVEYRLRPDLPVYELNRNTIRQMAQAEEISLWLDDSSQTEFWRSQNPDWTVIGIPALPTSAPAGNNPLYTTRGWFVDRQQENEAHEAIAASLAVFMSINPDCQLLMALHANEPISGFLPATKNRYVWQKFQSLEPQSKMNWEQWQAVLAQDLVSVNVLTDLWSLYFQADLSDSIEQWFFQPGIDDAIFESR